MILIKLDMIINTKYSLQSVTYQVIKVVLGLGYAVFGEGNEFIEILLFLDVVIHCEHVVGEHCLVEVPVVYLLEEREELLNLHF